MTKKVILILILALSAPWAMAHNASQTCADLLQSDASAMQREIFRLEAAGRRNEASALRTRLEVALRTLPIVEMIEPLTRFRNSKPKIARVAGGTQAIAKGLLPAEDAVQSPKSEIAAYITNEELGFPIRIPITVWRTEPEPLSLQLWFTPEERAQRKADDGDLALFDFLIDNYDRVDSNVIGDKEFGNVAIDNAAAFNELTVIPDWSNLTIHRHNCVSRDFVKRVGCVADLLQKWDHQSKLDWAKMFKELNVPRLVKRLEPWMPEDMLKRTIIRLCVMKHYFDAKDYAQCLPYVKDAGF